MIHRTDPDAPYFVDGAEVDKAEYVRVERACGFRNTMGQPEEPGTSMFAGLDDDGVRHEGRMGFLAGKWLTS